MADRTRTPARKCPSVCIVDGCRRAHLARGMCGLHYGQWRAVQQALLPTRCSVASCNRPIKCKGLCGAHYSRQWRNNGSVSADRPIRRDLPQDMWWCPRCRLVKPKMAFDASIGRPSGVGVYCKPCWSDANSTTPPVGGGVMLIRRRPPR